VFKNLSKCLQKGFPAGWEIGSSFGSLKFTLADWKV